MELSVARPRAVSAPDLAPREDAHDETAQLAAPATTASYPPLARGSMVARPWEAHPLRALLRRLLSRQRPDSAAPTKKPWQKTAHRRRAALTWATLIPAAIATAIFADGIGVNATDWMAWLQLGIFGLLSTWIIAGFWTGVIGFVTLVRGGDPAGISAADVKGRPIDRKARTAIIMPICNEHVPTVFAGLRSTCESLAATGATEHFDFFILSDTNDPDLRTAEAAAWNDLVEATGGRGRIFYRWRPLRTRRKAGNVADFCRRWGRNYRYMVVLDADSVMSGDCLTTLVRLMEAHPDAGIIQTAPKAVGCDTLHARIQQFAARVTGSLFSVGMQYWQLGESHYWGHNAIIRVQPFMQHCGLARLSGNGAMGGEVMSHDFIEAALMRRAGYHVWLVADLGGSYEQVPPTLLAELQRDRRWCHGNLQNFRLFLEPGLHPVHRAMLLAGAFSYLAAPFWLAFTLLSTLGATLYATPITLATLSSNPAMLMLLLTMAALLVVPKILAVALLFIRNEVHLYGGGARVAASAALEFFLSALYAPIRMVFHTRFVIAILAGKHGGWKSPPRDEASTPWSEAARRHALHMGLALAWLVTLLDTEPGRAWWLLPLVSGLLLAIPLSVFGSRAQAGAWLRNRGLLLIPEERWAPDVLRQVRRHLMVTPLLPSFAAVIEPGVNFLLRAISGRSTEAWGLKAARAHDRAHAAVDAELPSAERLRLLNDPYALALAYRLSTTQAELRAAS